MPGNEKPEFGAEWPMHFGSWLRRKGCLFAGLSATLIASGALAAAGPGAQPRIVRVGVYQNKPKIFMDENGRASGLFIDLLAEIARAEGWNLAFVPCQWTDCLSALDDGKLDLMPDVAYSRERAERYDFHHTPVLESWSQIYTRAGDSIHALADLDGRRIAVLRGSIQVALFEQMMTGFGFNVIIVPTESFESAFQGVQNGTADAAIVNHFFGDYFHREFGLVRTPIVFQVAELHYVTAAGRNPELLLAIDRRLDQWRREPNSIYYTTLGRWMDRPPVGIVPGRILWIIGGSVGILVLAFGLILVLRYQVRVRTRHLLRVNEDLLQVEASLRESELKHRTLFETASDAIFLMRRDRFIDCNARSLTMFGCTRDQVIGASLNKFSPPNQPDGRPSVEKALEKINLALTEGPQFFEWEHHREDRTPFFAEVSLNRIQLGGDVLVQAIVHDVTERKQSEVERQKLEEQLLATQKMDAIGRLAGGVAHDFNNLLMVILSYAGFALKKSPDGVPIRNDILEVKKAGERAAALTR